MTGNIFGGGTPRGRRGGGDGGNIFGGGKPSTPKPKKKKDDGGGGGIGGFLKETVKMPGKLVTGIPQMAADLATEVKGNVTGKNSAKSLLPQHALEGGSFLDTVIKGGDELDPDRPFSSGYAQSLHRTFARADDIPLTLVGKGDYAEAYREGGLPGMLLEDVGNWATVASVAGKGLNVASNGAVAELGAERAAVAGLERSIPKLTKTVDDLDSAVAQTRKALDDPVLAEAADPVNAATAQKLKTQLADQERKLAGAKSQVAEQEARLATHQGNVGRLTKEATPIVRAGRMLDEVSKLGYQGANIPAKPFSLGAKGMGKAGAKLLKASPKLNEALTTWAQNLSRNRMIRREVESIIGRNSAEADVIIHQIRDAERQMERLAGGDQALWHASMLDLEGVGELMGPAMERFRATVGDEMADAAVRDIVESVDWGEVDPRALQIAMDIARGVADEATVAKVRAIQAVYEKRLAAQTEARYLAGEGATRVLTPEDQAYREWNVEGDGPNPTVVANQQAREAVQTRGAQFDVKDAKRAVAKARSKIRLDPKVIADLSGTMQRNADIVAQMAQQVVDGAMKDPALMADLMQIKALSRFADDPVRLASALAQQLEKAASQKALARRHPILGRLARRMVERDGYTPIPLRATDAPTSAVERAAAAEATATSASRRAERTRAVADRLANAQDAAVESVVRAADALLKRRRRAAEAAAKGAEARARIAAKAALPDGEMPDYLLTADEYAARAADRPVAEGATQPTLAGERDWTHAGLVADAMEAGEGVPKWVVDEYRPQPLPRRPENTARKTHWNADGSPKSSSARAYLVNKRMIEGENARLASNPHAQRIERNLKRAEQRWNASGAGKAYAAALKEVRATRRAVVEAADAELGALSTSDALPDSVPFVPGGIGADFHDQIAQALGADDWRIATAMDDLRGRHGWKGKTEEALFVGAYNKAWERLPASAQQSLRRMSTAELKVLFDRWLNNDVGPDAFRLDEMVDEWYRGRTGSKLGTPDRERAYAEFVDAYERKARLQRIVKSGERGGFDAADLDGFFRSTADPAMLELADDATLRSVLERSTQVDAARALFGGEMAERAAAALPSTQVWDDLWNGEPRPGVDTPEALVLEAFGGNRRAASDFLNRWAKQATPLEDVIEGLARGEVPAWADDSVALQQAAVARAERRAAAAQRLDAADERVRYPEPGQRPGRAALTADERAVLDETVTGRQALNPEPRLRSVVAERGGAEQVGRLADQADVEAARAAARARANPLEEARVKSAASAADRMRNALVGHGKQVERWQRALSDLRFSERRLAALPEKQAAEMAALVDDIQNAPARYRAPLHLVRSAAAVFDRMEKNLGPNADQITLSALNDLQMDLVKTLRDVTRATEFRAGPGGTVIPLDPLIDPKYVPGGRVPERKVFGKGAKTGEKITKGSSQRERRTGVQPRTTLEQERVMVRTAYNDASNKSARELEATFGRRPAEVIGEERAAELGAQVREAQEAVARTIEERRAEVRAMPKGPARTKARQQLKRDEAKLNLDGQKAVRDAGNALIAEMKEKGYVPWDPRKIAATEANPYRLGHVVIDDGTELTTATMWVPEPVVKAFESTHRGHGRVEHLVRMLYDKPTNVWRAAVLALSPRWQVNNTLGNFVQATLGGGLTPGEWASAMLDARALLRENDLRFLADNADVLGATARQKGRVTRRLEKAEARIAKMDPEVRESVLGPDGVSLDPRIPQRGAGVAGLDPTAPADVSARAPRWYKRGHDVVQKSYEVNGFMDDLARVAVYLKRYEKMTDAELYAFAADNPSLAAHVGDLKGLRREAAVRMSLDALGNFRKMNRFERQWVRRAIPFYAWMKHITTLTFRLPVYHPLRVVWTMHLADLYGDEAEFPLLAGSLPLGGDSYLRLPRANPFEDVAALPQSGDPRDIIGTIGKSVGPIPRLASLIATGIDPSTLQPVRRPPGDERLDAYGRSAFNPVTDPEQVLSVVGNLFPQVRLGRAAVDTIKYGEPVLRYPTGDPYKTGAGSVIPAGRPLLSEALGLIGAPYPMNIETARIREAADERLRTNERAKARYRRTPAPAASGSNIFG